MVADALARATGRRLGDLDVQVIALALVWALIAAIRRWHASGYVTPLEEAFDRALAVVESGLQLHGPARAADEGASATVTSSMK